MIRNTIWLSLALWLVIIAFVLLSWRVANACQGAQPPSCRWCNPEMFASCPEPSQPRSSPVANVVSVPATTQAVKHLQLLSSSNVDDLLYVVRANEIPGQFCIAVVRTPTVWNMRCYGWR